MILISKCEQIEWITILLLKLEIRSVEPGICPIAKSTINELFL